MTYSESRPINRRTLLDYFIRAAKPREGWRVGMELERLGRSAVNGKPIPYDGTGSSVRRVLELYRERRGGDPIWEGDHLIGVDSRQWGTITLEPGGQVEWSSRPKRSLGELRCDLTEHIAALEETGRQLDVDWLEQAVDPIHPVSAMPWMPKARYNIMAPFLGQRGRLAHRMMTQTASIQCAFDYDGPDDWRRKFVAATRLAPVATALFANSSRVDGAESGYQSYRQAIWNETDPARCRLPEVVFDPGFGLEAWLDWILQVPTIFRHRARGLVPAGGPPFAQLLDRTGCDAIRQEDWETHVSTIFTEVRSYTYIEVRSADLQPDHLAFSVPTFWTGILYEAGALEAALDLCSCFGEYQAWNEAMEIAARLGLDGSVGGRSLRELASQALVLSARGLDDAACADDPAVAVAGLRELASARGLPLE